jgi:hypothetical protein
VWSSFSCWFCRCVDVALLSQNSLLSLLRAVIGSPIDKILECLRHSARLLTSRPTRHHLNHLHRHVSPPFSSVHRCQAGNTNAFLGLYHEHVIALTTWIQHHKVPDRPRHLAAPSERQTRQTVHVAFVLFTKMSSTKLQLARSSLRPYMLSKS